VELNSLFTMRNKIIGLFVTLGLILSVSPVFAVEQEILLGETILGSAATSISVAGFASSRSLRFEIGIIGASAAYDANVRFNSDTGNNYTWSYDGYGGQNTNAGVSSCTLGSGYATIGSSDRLLVEMVVQNEAGYRKQVSGTSSYGSASYNRTGSTGCEWNESTNAITTILVRYDGTVTFNTGSYIRVYGLATESSGSSLPANASGYLKNDGSGNLSWDNASTVKTFLSLGNVENTALSTWAGTSNITTLGTIGTGTWQATTLGVGYGGTGQTSYTDGQLLIGNTTGNTLAKATLTAGTNVTVTNGNGTITVASTGGGGGSLPADADGFLNNDGAGNLSWQVVESSDMVEVDMESVVNGWADILVGLIVFGLVGGAMFTLGRIFVGFASLRWFGSKVKYDVAGKPVAYFDPISDFWRYFKKSFYIGLAFVAVHFVTFLFAGNAMAYTLEVEQSLSDSTHTNQALAESEYNLNSNAVVPLKETTTLATRFGFEIRNNNASDCVGTTLTAAIEYCTSADDCTGGYSTATTDASSTTGVPALTTQWVFFNYSTGVRIDRIRSLKVNTPSGGTNCTQLYQRYQSTDVFDGTDTSGTDYWQGAVVNGDITFTVYSGDSSNANYSTFITGACSTSAVPWLCYAYEDTLIFAGTPSTGNTQFQAELYEVTHSGTSIIPALGDLISQSGVLDATYSGADNSDRLNYTAIGELSPNEKYGVRIRSRSSSGEEWSDWTTPVFISGAVAGQYVQPWVGLPDVDCTGLGDIECFWLAAVTYTVGTPEAWSDAFSEARGVLSFAFVNTNNNFPAYYFVAPLEAAKAGALEAGACTAEIQYADEDPIGLCFDYPDIVNDTVEVIFYFAMYMCFAFALFSSIHGDEDNKLRINKE